MKNYLNGKCPVEVYGAEVAADVLPQIYEDQPECARIHGCVRSGCLLDGVWPEQEEPVPEDG